METTLPVPHLPRGPFLATGRRPRDARRERILASPHQREGVFQNPIATRIGEPTKMLPVAWQYLAGREERVPKGEVPASVLDAGIFQRFPADGLRATWMGHSSVLLEIDGHRVLTDPVWSTRIGPVRGTGPRRFLPPPVPLGALPRLDAVLISHDHYDHLDAASVMALATCTDAPFVTALGVGAHLEHWGIPAARITELDWWETARIGRLEITAAPARHFSGRATMGRRTLWASWALKGPTRSVWFSGDTGPWDGFAEVGAKLGPFDLSLIEIGAWHASWGNIHLGPDAAMKVHQQVGAKVMKPVHWGTFNLALHAWDDPITRLIHIAEDAGVQLAAPLVGESVVPERPVIADAWRVRADRARVVG
jgi:L-ascorbate metabolism protein UlaG (beta-lactamase superfamily)